MADDPAQIFAEINAEGVTEMTDAIMTEGYVPQDFAEITDEEMEAAYATALNLINAGQFEKAEHAFQFLSYLNHYEAKFWLGLGVARQMQSKYEDAIAAYTNAGLHDVGNPIPPLRATECYIALDDLDQAEKGISAVKHWCEGQEEFAGISARADALLEGIERKRKG